MCLCDRGNDFVSVTTIYYLKFENYSDGSSLPPPPPLREVSYQMRIVYSSISKEKKISLLSDPQKAQSLDIWFSSARNPASKLDLYFWYPLIFIQTKFGRDHDHEQYKQMKGSQNIQRLGHTRFTSCSSDLVLNVNFFSFFFGVIFDERNVKYYAENIILIFFMYFQKRETIF